MDGLKQTMELYPSLETWDEIRPGLFRELLERGMPTDRVTAFLTAAEEIFVNIVAYAFPGGFGDTDTLTLQIKEQDLPPQAISLIFTDSGIPFDPAAVPPRPPVSSFRGLAPGGWGIHMAKEKSDRMVYTRCEGRNILELTKYLESKR